MNGEDELLLRYRYNDGSAQAAFPMRVIIDTAEVPVPALDD